MKLFFLFALVFSVCTSYSQSVDPELQPVRFLKDTLITIEANPEEGFLHDYLMFIPKGTPKGRATYLLVEPNNTGFTSDSMEEHLTSAIYLATKRSIGNNVSTELKIPFLVPVFPRTKKDNLIYTHALDRDVMLSRQEDIQRLDLQLLAMIEDARPRLAAMDLPVEDKVLLSGFSASGSFVNRFLFLHPGSVKAVTAGGLNGILMLPLKEMNGHALNYPLGINDLQEITGKKVDLEKYKRVPQFIFMGALDDNDAVPYDDAYDDEEREVIYATVGKQMQPTRWEKCQQIYRDEGVNAVFRTYAEVGHGSTAEVNLEVIHFFATQISAGTEE